MLETLLTKYKEKCLLEKRLNNLEMNISHESEGKDREPGSPDSSIRKRTNSTNRIKRMIDKLGRRCSNFQPSTPSSLETSMPLSLEENENE